MCGGVVESVIDPIDNALVGLDKTVGDVGGWPIVGTAAAALATGGASLFGSAALTAAEVAAADGIAMSTYGMTAAEAMGAGVAAADLGLPAAATAAQVGAVAGTASAEYLGAAAGAGDVFGGYSATGSAAGTAGADLGSLASNVGGAVSSGASASTSMTDLIAQDALALKSQGLGAEQIAQTLSQSYGIDQYAAANVAGMATGGSNAAQIAGVLASDYGTQMTGVSQGFSLPSIGSIIKNAGTGAQIIGGLGKLVGAAQGISAGRQVSPGQADPYAQYRPGNAAMLQNLLSNPNSISQTPGYQFNLAQGLQQMQAQQAAQGRLVSGGALLQSQNFGQSLANQTYNQQVDTLARLSGAYQAPATGAGAMQGVAFGNAGAGNYAYNAIGGGIGQVGTGLLNLYENYNKPSPNATA
jgi:hypothetical protein